SRFWRHAQNISGGLQEYIEAFSFFHYVECGGLVTYEQMQANFSCKYNASQVNYAFGISDFTGELMRLAMTSMSKPNGRNKATQISEFSLDLETRTPHIHSLDKKQVAPTQSLRKIEEAAYAIPIRSSEYGLSPWMLDHIVSQVHEDKES
ncbi:Translin, partial [Lactarius sanguifluus]